jgi:hypothetical protein
MNTSSNQLLLDQVSGATRLTLVKARRLAMRGSLAESLSLIDAQVGRCSATQKESDHIALALLKAELLHLDIQDQKALDIFDAVLVPRMAKLSDDLRFIIENNRNDVAFSLFSPTSATDFYHLVDRQSLVGFDIWDSRSVAIAEEAVAEGKHNQALAAFWRELVRAYRQGCWRPFHWAAKRMARECLDLGLPHEAVYHTLVAQVDKLVEQIGVHLLARRDVNALRQTVAKLISTANLQRHFRIACHLLVRIGDGVPDDQVDSVAQWLLSRCGWVPSDREQSQTVEDAWKALEAIAWRLAEERAQEAAGLAVNHLFWCSVPSTPNSVLIGRKQLVRTVNRMLYVLPKSEMETLCRQTVPLAKERKQDYDYPDVVNLLCHIAHRGSDGLKEWIGDQLFPPGQPVTFLVGQVASTFGKQFLPAERLSQNADQIARNIRLQVQRLGLNEEAVTVPGTMMTYSSACGQGKIIVSVAQGVELHTMARHRKDIAADSLARLLQAVLTMIADRENVLINRMELIHGLMEFGDCLTDDLAGHALGTLEPLAQGVVEEPTTAAPAAAADNPLNPFKMRMGTPAEVRGMSLFALAKISRWRADTYLPKLQPLLEDALSDSDPDVRRYAYAAAREMPKLSEPALMAVLLGTRDPDPNAASAAFAALATKSDPHMTRTQWQQFIYTAKMASQSPAASLRRTAALALKRLCPSAPNRIQDRLAELISTFAKDVCASVRSATFEVEEDGAA